MEDERGGNRAGVVGRRADDGDGERSDGVGEEDGASGAAGGEARGRGDTHYPLGEETGS